MNYMHKPRIIKILEQKFGLKKLKQKQLEVMKNYSKTSNTLFIAPTGYGKSLCYQLPAILSKGITVVVSPLIALMNDQISKLKSLNIEAECINSQYDSKTNKQTLYKVKNNALKLLYIAPESFILPENYNIIINSNISLIVLDEAHCLTTWGNDFRIAYKLLFEKLKTDINTIYMALTATADKHIIADLKNSFDNDLVVIREKGLRKNLALNVISINDDADRMSKILYILKNHEGLAIVYSSTKKSIEFITEWLKENNINCEFYHSKSKNRLEVEDRFKNGHLDCIVATSAFGLGIDIKNIRLIIHASIPYSLIDYYQQIGRAGRDGKPSNLYLLYHPSDFDSIYDYQISNNINYNNYKIVYDNIPELGISYTDLTTKTNMSVNSILDILKNLNCSNVIRKEKKFQTCYYKNGDLNQLFDVIDKDFSKTKMTWVKSLNDYCKNKEICRYEFLLKEILDEKIENRCGNCDIDNSEYVFNLHHLEKYKNKYNSFLENINIKNLRFKNGTACAFYEADLVGKFIKKYKYYDHFVKIPDNMLSTMIEIYNQWKNEIDIDFDFAIPIPATKNKGFVYSIAQKFCNAINIELKEILHFKESKREMKTLKNTNIKKANIKNNIVITDKHIPEIQNKNILIIDDIYDTGTTTETVGNFLKAKGSSDFKVFTFTRTKKHSNIIPF